ncbi:hypothetical protein yfred0001_16320 [Yersinia frederiksenii ATCC 33641]|nr:hypothetical protein yfred0001_16320 [Yersinia frederiksenii ATCC 33641]
MQKSQPASVFNGERILQDKVSKRDFTCRLLAKWYDFRLKVPIAG